MRLRRLALSLALIATVAACDSAARRQREIREQFQRQQAELKRQEDSAIAATLHV